MAHSFCYARVHAVLHVCDRAIRNWRWSFLMRITWLSLKPTLATSTPCNQHYSRKFCIEQIHRIYTILHKVTSQMTHLPCLLVRTFTFLESLICNETMFFFFSAIVILILLPIMVLIHLTRSHTCISAYIHNSSSAMLFLRLSWRSERWHFFLSPWCL